MTLTDANDFLMGGGVTSAKFPIVGTTVTGTICRPPEVQQQTDVTTGEPKFWPSDGKPMQQLQVQLQTNERDPSIDYDDGVRAVYVKGKMQAAVREAVRRSGAKGLEIGGTLTVTYTGDGEATKRGMNAPKIYSAVYIPAPAVAANAFLENGDPGQPAPAAPAPAAPQDPWNSQAPAPAWAQPAPAPAPAYAPPAPAYTPAPAPAPVAPAGVTNEALAAARLLSPEQRAVLFTPEQLATLGL